MTDKTSARAALANASSRVASGKAFPQGQFEIGGIVSCQSMAAGECQDGIFAGHSVDIDHQATGGLGEPLYFGQPVPRGFDHLADLRLYTRQAEPMRRGRGTPASSSLAQDVGVCG